MRLSRAEDQSRAATGRLVEDCATRTALPAFLLETVLEPGLRTAAAAGRLEDDERAVLLVRPAGALFATTRTSGRGVAGTTSSSPGSGSPASARLAA